MGTVSEPWIVPATPPPPERLRLVVRPDGRLRRPRQRLTKQTIVAAGLHREVIKARRGDPPMPSTVVGTALRRDDVARWRSADGDVYVAKRAVQPRRLRQLQPHAIVDVDHDGERIGEVLAYLVSALGHLDVVAVLDVPPPPEEDLYWSLDVEHRNGDDVVIHSAALVTRPAALGLRPVVVLWGIDARRPVSGLPRGTSDHVASLAAIAHKEYRRRLPHVEVRKAYADPAGPDPSQNGTPQPGGARWTYVPAGADIVERRTVDTLGPIEHGAVVKNSILSVR